VLQEGSEWKGCTADVRSCRSYARTISVAGISGVRSAAARSVETEGVRRIPRSAPLRGSGCRISTRRLRRVRLLRAGRVAPEIEWWSKPTREAALVRSASLAMTRSARRPTLGRRPLLAVRRPGPWRLRALGNCRVRERVRSGRSGFTLARIERLVGKPGHLPGDSVESAVERPHLREERLEFFLGPKTSLCSPR
jgi:hypothetical protein